MTAMHPTPYLFFAGNCKEAMEFYAKALNGKVEAMMKGSDAPKEDQQHMGDLNLVMHACVEVPGVGRIMASDSPPQYYTKPQGFAVSMHPASVAESERIFKALSAGGSVTMPIGKTFWSAAFGMCTDQFGIPWMVNCTEMPK